MKNRIQAGELKSSIIGCVIRGGGMARELSCCRLKWNRLPFCSWMECIGNYLGATEFF